MNGLDTPDWVPYRPEPSDPVGLRWGALACQTGAREVPVRRLPLTLDGRPAGSAISYVIHGLDIARFVGPRAAALHEVIGRIGLRQDCGDLRRKFARRAKHERLHIALIQINAL